MDDQYIFMTIFFFSLYIDVFRGLVTASLQALDFRFSSHMMGLFEAQERHAQVKLVPFGDRNGKHISRRYFDLGSNEERLYCIWYIWLVSVQARFCSGGSSHTSGESDAICGGVRVGAGI
jgi:hypothetical protein